ncbi:MAG: tripartite tricarboxylate transporter substrate-binding protein [Betaproteobacteria bacterium]
MNKQIRKISVIGALGHDQKLFPTRLKSGLLYAREEDHALPFPEHHRAVDCNCLKPDTGADLSAQTGALDRALSRRRRHTRPHDRAQSFVVDNRTGSAGIIGTEAVARPVPGGHTLLMGAAGTHATNPAAFDQQMSRRQCHA